MKTDQPAKGTCTHYAWVILGVGTVVVFAALGLARFSYTSVLPAMQQGLGMDNSQAGALATANLVGYLLLSAVGGALAAHYGPRRVISLGLLVAAIGMVMTGMADGILEAGFGRVISGAGSGASNVPVMGLLAAWFVRRRRGLAAGICVTGSSFALIGLGPTVPRLLQQFGANGWRVCWLIFGVVTFLIAAFALLLLRDRPEEMGLEPYGASPTSTAAAKASAFPVWGQVYRSWRVWHLGLIYVAFGFSYIIYITFYSKFLIAEGGLSEVAAGRLLMLLGWLSLFCGLIWGAVSDHWGRKQALIMVYLIHSAAFGIFALLRIPQGFLISTILFGISAWSIPAIMAAACGDLLGSRLAPAGLGFVTLFFGVGQATGPSVAGMIADATHSFVPAFLLAAAIALLGAIGAYFLPEDGKQA